MAEKASAPPPQGAYPTQPQGQGQYPEHPPSYEASVGPSGGFVDPKGQYQQAPPPPPVQQHGPPPAQQPQTVIVQYMNPPNFGHNPVNMTCPHCQSQIRTSTDSEPGPMAWILAGILCVVGLWPCACIPCCIDSLNSVTHKCPNCKNFLGRYKGGM